MFALLRRTEVDSKSVGSKRRALLRNIAFGTELCVSTSPESLDASAAYVKLYLEAHQAELQTMLGDRAGSGMRLSRRASDVMDELFRGLFASAQTQLALRDLRCSLKELCRTLQRLRGFLAANCQQRC